MAVLERVKEDLISFSYVHMLFNILCQCLIWVWVPKRIMRGCFHFWPSKILSLILFFIFYMRTNLWEAVTTWDPQKSVSFHLDPQFFFFFLRGQGDTFQEKRLKCFCMWYCFQVMTIKSNWVEPQLKLNQLVIYT